MVAKYDKTIKYTAGGATQNSMRVAQWMIGVKHVCAFTGCIGADLFGDMMRSEATKDGVNVLYMVNPNEKTGTCAVCITAGGAKRSLCAYLGAANTFKKDHLEEIWSSVEQASVYYVSGFHLTVSPESILAIAKHSAEKPDKKFCFNLSAPFISQFFSEQLLSVIPYVDILFGNESEAAAFASLQKWSDTSVRDIAVKISKLEKSTSKGLTVVITQGEDNIIVVTKKGEVVQEFKPTRLDASQIVDTNGAGDAFVGGFLSQLVLGKGLDTCVAAGTYAATEVIQLSGATFPAVCKFVTPS